IGFGRSLFGAVLGGIAAVYVLGVVQLALVTGMDWQAALLAGAVPFIPGDLLKATVAATVAVRLAPGAAASLRPSAAGQQRGGARRWRDASRLSVGGWPGPKPRGRRPTWALRWTCTKCGRCAGRPSTTRTNWPSSSAPTRWAQTR